MSAARKRHLRPVGHDEQTPTESPQAVSVAASTGTRLDLLLALRARIATAVEDLNTRPADLASLSRRLLEISREIEAAEGADGRGDDIGRAAATADEDWAAI